MSRPTKRQQFRKELLTEIETNPQYQQMKEALYKELLLHHSTGEPRWLFDNIMSSALSYYDYIIQQDRTLTPEEIVTDLGDYIENEFTKKMIEDLNKITVLK